MPNQDKKEIALIIKTVYSGFRKFGFKKLIKALELEPKNTEKNNLFQSKVIHFIINLVCAEYGITLAEMKENKFRGVPKLSRKIAIILCTENLIISDDKLKEFFDVKNRQVIYYSRKEFKKMNRKNITDQKLFFSTYDKLNKEVLKYIINNK